MMPLGPQVSSSASKHDVHCWESLSRTLLMNKRVPSVVMGVEKTNLTKYNHSQLQLTPKCPKKLDIKDSCTNIFIHPIQSRITSTCHSTFRSCHISPCRKSHSMIELSSSQYDVQDNNNFGCKQDLTFSQMNRLAIDTMNIFSPTIRFYNSLCNIPMANGNREQLQEMSKKAASIICHTLILNAWRHRRTEVTELYGTIQQLVQQIDHLQLQTIVLRRLLDTENIRVGKLGKEIHRTKSQLENITKEKSDLATKQEILENEAKKLKEVSEERIIASENWKNELLSIKNQFELVKAQSAQNLENLLRLREDKKTLLERVLANETLAREHGERADRAELVAKNLQSKIVIQMTIIDRLQDDKLQMSRELRVAETEKNRMEKCLSVIDDAEKTLGLQVENLKVKLSDREAALRKIELAYNTQLIELNDMKKELLSQSQQIGWSSRVLRIATSIVHTPRAFFLHTFNPISSTS